MKSTCKVRAALWNDACPPFISFGRTSGRVEIICVSSLCHLCTRIYIRFIRLCAPDRIFARSIPRVYAFYQIWPQPFREAAYFNNNNRSRKVYNECLFYSIYIRDYCTLFHFYVVLSRSSIARSFNAYYRSFYFYHGYLFSDLSHPFALSITYYFISAKSVPFFAIRSSSIIYFRFISIVIFHSGDLF